MWLGEQGHRELLTGNSVHHFTNIEEKECLGLLVSSYASFRKDGKTPVEPELERLGSIIEAEMADEFVLVELGTRVLPRAPLFVPEATRQRLKAYIRRFVIERQTRPPDAGAK
jgi:hypothetical protein